MQLNKGAHQKKNRNWDELGQSTMLPAGAPPWFTTAQTLMQAQEKAHRD